jgi:hypothetical protein
MGPSKVADATKIFATSEPDGLVPNNPQATQYKKVIQTATLRKIIIMACMLSARVLSPNSLINLFILMILSP